MSVNQDIASLRCKQFKGWVASSSHNIFILNFSLEMMTINQKHKRGRENQRAWRSLIFSSLINLVSELTVKVCLALIDCFSLGKKQMTAQPL